MTNVNQMDLVANGFIRDFQAARRNLSANGNPNIGESTGNFGGSTAERSRRAPTPTSRTTTSASSPMRSIGARRASAWRPPVCPDDFFRPNPQFSIAGVGCTCSSSQYNALQLQLQKRFAQGLAFGVNYTLAKSTDDVSNDTRGAGTELVVPSDPKRLELDQGRSDFDVRHVVRGNFIWDLPFGKGAVSERRLRPGQRAGRRLADQRHRRRVERLPVQRVLGLPHVHVLRQRHARGDDERERRHQPRGLHRTGASARSAARTAAWSSSPPKNGRCSRRPKPAAPGPSATCSPGPGYFQIDLGIFKNFTIGGQRLELRTRSSTCSNGQLRRSQHPGDRRQLRHDHRHAVPRIIQSGAKWCRTCRWSSGFTAAAGRRATRPWWPSSRRPSRRGLRLRLHQPPLLPTVEMGAIIRDVARRWLGAQEHRRARRRPGPAAGDGPFVGRAARRADVHRRSLRESGRLSLTRSRAASRSMPTRSTCRRSSRWPRRAPGAPPAAADVRSSPEVRQRSREASRLLGRHARREGQGHPAVPDPAHRRPPRHHRAGATLGQRARGGGIPAKVVAGREATHASINDNLSCSPAAVRVPRTRSGFSASWRACFPISAPTCSRGYPQAASTPHTWLRISNH